MNRTRPTVALCVIAKNEAENIDRFFDSIEGCFDEVHFTDTGSTDNTVELAQKRGAIIHHFQWCDDFSAARNYSFSHSKSDFTAWLDLDDVLSNKEAFKSWRDDAMGVADFWMANYNYALDPKGNPTCTFLRERVVRTSKQFHWQYPIHEGMTPQTGIQPVRTQMATTWTINHLRNEKDLVKDRSRNLSIIEGLKHKDTRMEYYYGKELFENGKYFDAATVLSQVIAKPDLEMHDRVLGFEYACKALLACNQFEKALSLANQGTMLAPSRAELYCLIGDCFIKMNRIMDALPAYSAALGCTPSMGNIPTPIFESRDCYGIYPTNHIIRIKTNIGAFAEAIKIAEDFYAKCPNPETKLLLDEVIKYRHKEVSFKDAKPCDDIVISCPPQGPYEWDADIYKERSMGGSETAAIEMAYWLRKLSGRPVKVLNNRETAKTIDGVEYMPANRTVEYFAEHKPYLNIQWRHNYKLTDAPSFIWSHDLQTQGVENVDQYNKVLCLTPFHKRYMTATQGVPSDKIWVTRNGINPDRFKDGPWKKDPNKVIFPSSPDRGLDRAMRIMDKVRIKHPDAYLAVYYGIEHLPKYGRTDLMNELKAMMDERPWVKYYGATEQRELMKHFKEAAIWLYPSDWIETSCITASEILCAGAYPIVRRLGGVVDTLANAEEMGMASILDTECVTESEHQLFVDEVCKAIETKAWERVKIDPDTLSWEKVAKSWLEELPKLAYGV